MANGITFQLDRLIKGFALFLFITGLSVGLIELNITILSEIPRSIILIGSFGLFLYGLSKILKPFDIRVG